MRISLKLLLVLCVSVFSGCTDTDPAVEDSVLAEHTALAKCLTEKGWVMYGSSTCSACLAQRKMFGEAFTHIREIECNPHAPNSQAELCIAKEIRRTPTWILQQDGEELARLPDYQLMENLRTETGCHL